MYDNFFGGNVQIQIPGQGGGGDGDGAGLVALDSISVVARFCTQRVVDVLCLS